MSSRSFSETLEVKPYRYSASWLIGATTHAIDRFVADVERIYQPEQEHIGGLVKFNLASSPSIAFPKPRGSRKLRMLYHIRPPEITDVGDEVFFDIRENDYFNWSHQVNFFLTLALAARDRLGDVMTIVLPRGMPPAAFDLYSQFGFKLVSTDGPVKGRHFRWSVSHIEVVPSARAQLIAPFMTLHDDDPMVFPPFPGLPEKVFLSRRGSRALTNEDEIENVLVTRGFEKVYAEDLPVAQQFALLRQADEVVAIHGAGLAPLQYRSLSAPAIRLIELAPAGIMTRWFGIMCEQVGGNYISVRGRLKPEYIAGLYATAPFLQHCDDDFEIDPRSLEVALEIIGATPQAGGRG